MFTRTQHLLGACLALALASCVTVPKQLQGEFASDIPTGDTLADGALVRWGGEVISVEPRAEGTCFQILSRELNADARPKQYGNASGGRFLACHRGFFDPALYPEGTALTITGTLAGSETRKIGDFDLNMPRVAANTVYLWPDRPEWPYDYGYGPYPGYYYDPFWWGFYPRVGIYYGGYYGGHHHGHHGGHHRGR